MVENSFPMEEITAARIILKNTLEKSRDLSVQVNKTGISLQKSEQRLPALECAFRSIAKNCSLLTIIEHIDRAVGPTDAVLKVFDVVYSLEMMLLQNPCCDLLHYLSVVKRLEEALRFLTNNSGLVICWLEDVLQFSESNKAENDWILTCVKRCMSILRELHAMEKISRLCGGSLFIAFEKLETQFHLILMENTFPMALSSTGMSANALPVPVIQKLQSLIERLSVNNRIENCVTIYVEIRSSNAKSTMEALNLDYLDLSLSEFDSVQTVESYIDQWCTDLEIVVKHVLGMEYTLCDEIFQKVRSETRVDCSSEIAVKSGIHGFIKLGNTITKGKKDAVKLLKLLDMFRALNTVRLDFNRIFSGKFCGEIQIQMRNLIKKIVDGACDIFYDLSVQVELQKGSIPPTDGSVPRLVSFVTEFCNELLEDHYKTILIQVLKIQMSWQNERLKEGSVSKEIYKIMMAIELNLDMWVKKYEGSAISNIFLMNNHYYLLKNLKGTNLGDLMGDSWLKTHEHAMEYYAAIYLRESWGKLAALLSEDSLINVEERLKDFNTDFNDICNEQGKWVISDKRFRSKICDLVVEIIVPVYRSFMRNYYTDTGELEHGKSPNKIRKYSAGELEDMVYCLFQPNIRKYSSRRNHNIKDTELVGNVRNAVCTHFPSAPPAARVF